METKDTKTQIVQAIKEYFNDEEKLKKIEKLDKKYPGIVSKLKNCQPDDITLSDKVLVKSGHGEGHVTAEGIHKKDYDLKRTVSFEFSTKGFLVIDNKQKVSPYFSDEVSRIFGLEAIYEHGIQSKVQMTGDSLAKQNLRDLNFDMRSCRVNREKFVTEETFELDLQFIGIRITDKKGQEKIIEVGVLYEQDETEHIEIRFSEMKSVRRKNRLKLRFTVGFAVFLAGFIVADFVIFMTFGHHIIH